MNREIGIRTSPKSNDRTPRRIKANAFTSVRNTLETDLQSGPAKRSSTFLGWNSLCMGRVYSENLTSVRPRVEAISGYPHEFQRSRQIWITLTPVAFDSPRGLTLVCFKSPVSIRLRRSPDLRLPVKRRARHPNASSQVCPIKNEVMGLGL